MKNNFGLPMSGNLQTVARVRCGQQSISNSGHFSRQIAISEEYNCHTFLLISKDVKLSTKIWLCWKYVTQNTYFSTMYQMGIIGSIQIVPANMGPLSWPLLPDIWFDKSRFFSIPKNLRCHPQNHFSDYRLKDWM